MSEVPRVPGSGGTEPAGGRKDRGSLDDDKFKKLMKVEEVHEIDPHQKRSRKRREEGEEEAEEEVKKAGAAEKKGVKPIESAAGSPLEQKKVAPKAIPSSPAAPPSEKAAPMAAFRPEEIEAYAWEEEAQEVKAPPSPKAAAAAPSERPEISPPKILKAEGAAKQILGKQAPEQPPTAPAPPLKTSAPPPPFAPVDETVPIITKEEAAATEEPAKPYAEEWPHTTAYRPTPAFRTSEGPSPEPTSPERAPLQPRKPEAAKPEEEEDREKKKPKEPPAAPKKKAAPKEELAPPGTPVPRGKKEKAASFAEMMEEGAEKAEAPKEAGKKPAAAAAAGKEAIAPEAKGAKAPPPILPTGAEAAAAKEKPSIAPGPKELAAAEEAAAATAAGVSKEPPASAIQGIPPSEESFAFLKKTGGATISPEEAEEKEKREEGAGLLPAAGQLPESGTGMGGEGGGKKRGEGEEAEMIAAAAGAPSEAAPPLPHIEAPAPPAPSPYAQMSPQILALFERMVGVMTIIQTTGITETVLTLNARQFASSVLYGSQIIIREYSTAPTKFNVEFIGSPQALTLVQQNVPALLGAVQQGNFNFTINRFDVKLGGTERPIFTRKEAAREKSGEEEKEKEQETP